MKIEIQDYNNVLVMELQGELDGDSVEVFQNTIAEIIQKNKTGVVLDMSNVSFIDSEGLEQLLKAKDYCIENKCQLRLAGLDENCSKILEITSLESEFDHYVELAKAVKSFA
ncbi:MAG: STAS domain-containing protein [Planctomycetota bacterium]|jgi:anti-anti-sigma factor